VENLSFFLQDYKREVLPLNSATVCCELRKTGRGSSLISVKFRLQLSNVSEIPLLLSKLTQEEVSYDNKVLFECTPAHMQV